MPGEDFYSGLSLTDQLLKFAEHHYDPDTRHISTAEAQMLRKAAAAASNSARSASGKQVALALAVVGGGAVVIRQAAPRLRAVGRNVRKRPQPDAGVEDHLLTTDPEREDPRQGEA